MNVLFGIMVFCLAALAAEAVSLHRNRRAVARRILVTGTRGKTSLVRILAAACRAVEPATLGKTTGDCPELLLPDGQRRRLRRRGPARLTEQVRLLRFCRRRKIRCLVVEAMSITPEVMAAEMRLLQPTQVAVVNVRDDHRETLGCDPIAQRARYLETLPANAPWFTRDRQLLAQAGLGPGDGRGSGAAGEEPFPQDMLALARDVLQACGWATPAALAAASHAAQELVAAPRTVRTAGGSLVFLDAFSANDPESLALLWEYWQAQAVAAVPWSVLLATRADRPLRTLQFCRWLAGRRDLAGVFVAGSQAPFALRTLRRLDVRAQIVRPQPGAALDAVLALSAAADPPAVLVGIGNAGGLGQELRRALGGKAA